MPQTDWRKLKTVHGQVEARADKYGRLQGRRKDKVSGEEMTFNADAEEGHWQRPIAPATREELNKISHEGILNSFKKRKKQRLELIPKAKWKSRKRIEPIPPGRLGKSEAIPLSSLAGEDE
jgi:hypothetical protein